MAEMKNFGINLSKQEIPVYSNAGGGSKLGQLNKRESFTFTGSKTRVRGCEWHQIEFLSPNGWSRGWYKGVNGVSLWKNHPARRTYSGYCVCPAGYLEPKRDQGGFKYYKVVRKTSVKNGKGNHAFYVYAGEEVMVSESNLESGNRYHHLLRIRGVKGSGNRAQTVCVCNRTGDHFGYLDTGINRRSGSPNIVGDWA